MDEAERPEVPIPAPCRAAGRGTCPTPTTTLIDTSPTSPDPPKGNPLAVVAATPPTWNTKVSTDGYYLALDDGSIWLIGDESARIVAGTPGAKCPDGTAPCGDGGLVAEAVEHEGDHRATIVPGLEPKDQQLAGRPELW